MRPAGRSGRRVESDEPGRYLYTSGVALAGIPVSGAVAAGNPGSAPSGSSCLLPQTCDIQAKTTFGSRC
eukprot:9135737-Pyramimonas_sp.AAC.1